MNKINKNLIVRALLIFVFIFAMTTVFMDQMYVNADPMDPMNIIRENATDTTDSVGQSIQPNEPTMNTESSEAEESSEAIDDGQISNVKEWEQAERQSRAVQLMDSVMLFVGMIGVIVPTLYMGIYLGARIYPPLFLPIFEFIVKKKFQPEDLPWYIMFLRTLPVATLGMIIATGQIKAVFKFVWNFIYERFL